MELTHDPKDITTELPEDEVLDLSEGLTSIYDLLKAGNALKKDASRLVMVFVNRSFDGPRGAMLTIGNHITELYREAKLEEGVQSDDLKNVGLYKVSEFSKQELERVLGEAKIRSKGISGTLDESQLGLLDITGNDKLTLGHYNKTGNAITVARFDRRNYR